MNRIAVSAKDAETLYSTGKASVFCRIRPQLDEVYQGSGMVYLMGGCLHSGYQSRLLGIQ